MARKVKYPSYVGKVHICGMCGGALKVTKSTKIFVMNEPAAPTLVCVCPFCKHAVDLNYDVNHLFRKKLSTFIHSQVAPIKAIKDENVRLPMQKLLDDFNQLVQEE